MKKVKSPRSINIIDIYIGNNLKRQRMLQKISQIEAAKIINVSFQQYQKYELAYNRISASKLFLLSHFFQIDINKFFHGLKTNTIDKCINYLE